MPFQFRKEAIEEDLNSNFPSQGQGNPPLYYSLSEVVVPTYSINQAAEGSSLPSILQTAFDFSTGHTQRTTAGTSTLITNTGFWYIQVNVGFLADAGSPSAEIFLDSGITTKEIWKAALPGVATVATSSEADNFVVFVKSGESLKLTTTTNANCNVNYRQIATINGTLVNPLGYSAA